MRAEFIALLLINALKGGQADHPSSADCTWTYVEQPLSHFARGNAGTYKQRICSYDGYWEPHKGLPVLFYTGNESPVEEYVNNTGLMWDLAESLNALVIFAEHRYFGESVPDIEGMPQCLSYLSSEEALADYASFANRLRREWGAEDSAIIAFGGSYGGMLAAWMRILYPSAIDGALSASAPVWGFPLDSCAVDSSASVVTFAASAEAGAAPLCADNLKSSYVLMSDIASTEDGRKVLSSAMNLCTPLNTERDIASLLAYLQTPLFDLAEGSYPFPTDYITFALTGTDAPLPPWAMQVMCEPLGEDFGVKVHGEPKNVKFTVTVGDVEVYVDWDRTSNNGYSMEDLESSGALELANAVGQAIQVWYNVTGTLSDCIDWESGAAPNTPSPDTKLKPIHSRPNPLSKAARHVSLSSTIETRSQSPEKNDGVCTLSASEMDVMTAWNALVCNEGINLVNWWAQGMGNDLYWPPNQPKGSTLESMVPGSLAYCAYLKGMGLYGIPEKADDWSVWMDTAYGGLRLQYASNIFFSNGNLDPWSPAGVTDTSHHNTTNLLHNENIKKKYEPRQLSKDGSVVSMTIDMGGHHLDLFWPSEQDPESVRYVRQLETNHIKKWIGEASSLRKSRST